MSAKILQWRPKTVEPLAVRDPRLQWTMHKQQWRIDCTLDGCAADGWSVRVLLNGGWFFCCRFTSRGEAIQAVTDKYAELLAGGWAPAAIGAERQ
jgi:hypothetical protein